MTNVTPSDASTLYHQQITDVVTVSAEWEELQDRISNRSVISVLDKEIRGSSGISDVRNGNVSSTPIFQAAHDTLMPVYVPWGPNYAFPDPVLVTQGFKFFGDGGEWLVNGPTSGQFPVLRPTTAAFAPADPLAQGIGGAFSGLGLQGGTTQIDFGLLHGVTMRDMEFRGFNKAGFCLVRGESNHLENLRFDLTVNSTYVICFGYEGSVNYTGGLYAGQNPVAFFDTPDAWVDRMFMQSIKIQAGAGGATWTDTAIRARFLGGTVGSNITFHGNGSGDGRLISSEKILNTHFDSLIIDRINTTGTQAKGIECQLTNSSIFSNIHMSGSGNSYFTRGFDLGTCNGVTFDRCGCEGDNVSNFGFYFRDGWGQDIALNSCNGAIYSAGSNELIKQQIQLTACDFNPTNLSASGNQLRDWRDKKMEFSFYGDVNGASSANGAAEFWFSNGSGQRTRPFWIAKAGPFIENGAQLSMATIYGSGQEIKVLAHSGTPEGSVTANVGSLCIAYNGTGTSADLYLKSSGTASTGWKLITRAA